jgi:riboflavin transporter FmnP
VIDFFLNNESIVNFFSLLVFMMGILIYNPKTESKINMTVGVLVGVGYLFILASTLINGFIKGF